MQRLLAVFLALVFFQSPNAAEGSQASADRVGDVYQIRWQNSTETSGDGTSSRSRSSSALEERVVALREDGVELEFDLPHDASQEERARDWRFPARVLNSPDGHLQLLNRLELEARLPSWLQLGGFTQADCGRWIFTWNAFKIECDPLSVLERLSSVNLRLRLHEGALYGEPGARVSVPLRGGARTADSAALIAEMEIDPEFVRRERAESDVVVAEIMREPITLEAALQAWQRRQVSGTITSTIVRDAAGRVTSLTRITQITVVDEDGSEDRQTSTTTVERHLVSR
jgi:hypothetical protein